MRRTVYLDHAASSVPYQAALEEFVRQAQHNYANTEAVHPMAYRAKKELENMADRLVTALLGKSNFPVIWADSATGLFRMLSAVPEFGKCCTSGIEHPALIANLKKYTDLTVFGVDRNGNVQTERQPYPFDAGFLHQVQSEFGVVQDTAGFFDRTSPACKVVDAVQAAGKMPLDPNADIWVISGVKFGAPAGAAAIVDPHCRYADRIIGHAGKMRHEEYAVSRISLPAAAAMAVAAETAAADMDGRYARISALNEFIRDGIKDTGIVPLMSDAADVSPYILSLLLPTQESAVVVRALGKMDVFAASGSACSAESGQPSPALKSLGISGKNLFRVLRVSFGHTSTMEDAEIFLSALKNVLKNY